MVNVALWDAIEEQLGGEVVRPKGRHRTRTPFNAERRQAKIDAIAAHCKRHPGDKQSEVHADTMRARLLTAHQ